MRVDITMGTAAAHAFKERAASKRSRASDHRHFIILLQNPDPSPPEKKWREWDQASIRKLTRWMRLEEKLNKRRVHAGFQAGRGWSFWFENPKCIRWPLSQDDATSSLTSGSVRYCTAGSCLGDLCHSCQLVYKHTLYYPQAELYTVRIIMHLSTVNLSNP